MRFTLLRITHRLFGLSTVDSVQAPNAWLLYAWCLSDTRESCALLKQMQDMQHNDRHTSLLGLKKLIDVAATGKPLNEFYDSKKCHKTHEFEYKNRPRTIWRIRHGDVRISFYYGQGKVVLLTHIFPKRSDKLSEGQKKDLEATVKAYIDAEDDGALTILEDEQ
jgi:mRNA-degrading endonuclease RelE of RelBE toxin-antitoxin system